MNPNIVLSLLGLALAAYGQASTPSISTVLNAASFDARISPGCLVTIFGTNLAAAPLNVDGAQPVTTLGGVTITVAGFSAQLLYVSSAQINMLIPFEAQIPDT